MPDTRPWITLSYTAFDLETTGVDVVNDRIVTAAIIHIDPPQDNETGVRITRRNWLLNPGIDIPQGATDIHGITNDMAREHGQHYDAGYADIRQTLDRAWADGRMVVAYNASFDLGMMHHQGLPRLWPALTPGPVCDPYVLDHLVDKYRKGSRRLDAIAKHYRVRLDDAHDAHEDAITAARVAYRMRTLPALRDRSVEWLMNAQANAHRARQEHLVEYFTSKGQDASDVDVHWPVRGVDTSNTRQPVDASTYQF